jgi:hypothetical protein
MALLPVVPWIRRFVPALGVGCRRTQEAAISTVTIIVVVIWNALLLVALATMLVRHERLLQWITQLDGQQGLGRVASGEDGWAAFLKEHPELTDP